MSQFIVSARKYRPRQFEDVVGQEQVTRTLQNAINTGKIAQAYLFCGPRGVGKTTCARIFAREINKAATGEDIDMSFNIFELDAASNNSVDDIRTITDQVRIPPQTGKYKVYVIDEVHMLSSQAFNAFLKTLEEPPAYAIFILATTEKHKILPTILSRCQIYDFNRIKVKDIIPHLQAICDQEQIPCEPDALHLIAQKADGALRDALSIFDRLVSFGNGALTYQGVLDSLNILDYDYFFQATQQMLAEDSNAVLLLFDKVLNRGFEGETFLSGLAQHFRDLLMCRHADTIALLEAGEQLTDRYKDQAMYTPADWLLNGLSLLNQCELDYRIARNKRLLVELALLKLCYLPYAKNGQLLATDSGDDKKKTESPTVAAPEPTVNRAFAEIAPSDSTPLFQEEEEPVTPAPGTTTDTTANDKPAVSGRKKRTSSTIITEEVLPEETETTSPETAYVDSALTLTSEQLTSAWSRVLSMLNSAGENSKADLLTQFTPTAEGPMVTLTLHNKVQMELVSEIRQDMYNAMALELPQGFQFQLTYDLSLSTNQQEEHLTTREKWHKMAERNPTVLELQKRLDLDLEY